QVADEVSGVGSMEVRSVVDGTLLEELEQVLGGRAVAVDSLDRGAQDLFVVLQPAVAQVRNGEGLEAQCGGGPHGGGGGGVRGRVGGVGPRSGAGAGGGGGGGRGGGGVRRLGGAGPPPFGGGEPSRFSCAAPPQGLLPPQGATKDATNGKL